MKIAERQELLARVDSEIAKAEEQIAIDRAEGERLRGEYDAAVALGKNVDAVGYLTAANYHNGHSTALREAQNKFKGFRRFIETAHLDDIPIQAVLPEAAEGDSAEVLETVVQGMEPAPEPEPEAEHVETVEDDGKPFVHAPVLIRRHSKKPAKKARKPLLMRGKKGR